MRIPGANPYVRRRALLIGSTCFGLVMARPAFPQTHLVNDRLCIADNPNLHKLTAEQLQSRLNSFRDLGFGMIRTGIGRYGLHPEQDTPDLVQKLAFARQAITTGYKLKLQVGSWSAPPEEVLRVHSEARILNRLGETPPDFLSPWYPGLKDLLRRQAEAFFAYIARTGLMPAVTALIVDLGPAGEPIYPAAWVLGKEAPADYSFWFYDEYAQAAFGRDMQFRYSNDIRRANRRWQADFKTWADVQIPHPKSHPGAMWEDVITWYRDAKRAVIRFQVSTCKALVAQHYKAAVQPQIIMLVPGSHLRADEIRQAISTGDGDYGVKLMLDTEFVLDLAHEQGCAVQYTGAENEPEVEYVLQYMQSKGYAMSVWAENAGGDAALNPERLAGIVIKANLYGLDYINANSVVAVDGVTPNSVMPKLASACKRLLNIFPVRSGDEI